MKSFSFMVMGDAHLGRKFKTGITGSAELMTAFDTAIKIAKQRSANYVFVTGNLFDTSSPSETLLKHVARAFESLPSRVIIAPGSCDPSVVGSCYQTFAWPSNVYIFPAGEISYIEFNDRLRGTSDRDYVFSGGGETGRKGIRIYGSAFSGHFQRESLLVTADEKTPRLSSSYINVLVLHGKLVFGEEPSQFDPVPFDVLKECGFELSAIGGDACCMRKGNVIVPGVMCAPDFSVPGDCGVYVGEVRDGGFMTCEFINVSPVKYEIINFDATDLSDMTPQVIAASILRLANTANASRVDICGELPFDVNIDVNEVGKLLKDRFPLIEIRDRTVKKADLYLFSFEKSFRGFYTSNIWESVRQARDEQKKNATNTYNEKNYESAVNTGLKLFDNMGIDGFYSSAVDENGVSGTGDVFDGESDGEGGAGEP